VNVDDCLRALCVVYTFFRHLSHSQCRKECWCVQLKNPTLVEFCAASIHPSIYYPLHHLNRSIPEENFMAMCVRKRGSFQWQWCWLSMCSKASHKVPLPSPFPAPTPKRCAKKFTLAGWPPANNTSIFCRPTAYMKDLLIFENCKEKYNRLSLWICAFC
jgi:hypothetical protein